MSRIRVTEPYAALPRVLPVEPSGTWSPPLELDRGGADLIDTAVESAALDLRSCSELSIVGTTLRDVAFLTDDDDEVIADVTRSSLTQCELAQNGPRFETITASSFVGCKLMGSDFAEATLKDVVFEGCTLRYVNFRMASLTRVHFIDCALDDVDFTEARLSDVDFAGSKLDAVAVSRTKAERIDLRSAATLGVTGIDRLQGWLIREAQLSSLLYPLAAAVGVGIEESE